MIPLIFWHCSRSNLHPIQTGICNPKRFADIAAACIAFNRTIYELHQSSQQKHKNGQIDQHKLAEDQKFFGQLQAAYYYLY